MVKHPHNQKRGGIVAISPSPRTMQTLRSSSSSSSSSFRTSSLSSSSSSSSSAGNAVIAVILAGSLTHCVAFHHPAPLLPLGPSLQPRRPWVSSRGERQQAHGLLMPPPLPCRARHSRMAGNSNADKQGNSDKRGDDADNGNGDDGVQYRDGFTEALGNLLPGGKGVRNGALTKSATVLDGIDWGVGKAKSLSIEELAARLDRGLREKSWFVTGDILPELFSDEFLFKDPNVEVKGVKDYARGVNKLFDQKVSRMQVISCLATGAEVVTVTWRLEGAVNVGPGLDVMPYIVETELRAKGGLVISQEDKFLTPGWQIVAWALFPILRPLLTPAPPVEEG